MQTLNQWLSPQAVETLTSTTFLSVAGALVLLYVLSWCRIFARAGHHAALGLLMILPVVNFFMLLILAFASWPRERELRALRRVQRASRHADEVQLRRAA
jgi:ABC-type transport system involved in cytochrome bd biosynthesis fused ATPase/permease subunit